MSDTREKPDNWPIGGLLDVMRKVAREEMGPLVSGINEYKNRLDDEHARLAALERRVAALEVFRKRKEPILPDAEVKQPAPAPEPPVRPDPFSDYPCMPEPIMDDPAPEPSEEAVKVCVYCHAPITGRKVFSLDADGWVHDKVRTCIATVGREAGERMVRRFAAWLDDEEERLQGSATGRALAERFLKEGA